ncbi:hypothetical protein D3C80_2215740 [compost metagenome]
MSIVKLLVRELVIVMDPVGTVHVHVSMMMTQKNLSKRLLATKLQCQRKRMVSLSGMHVGHSMTVLGVQIGVY